MRRWNLWYVVSLKRLHVTIKRLREAKGWNQRDLPKRARVSPGYIGLMEAAPTVALDRRASAGSEGPGRAGGGVAGVTEGAGMDSDQLRRVMRDLGDAVNAYQQGQGFVGIEKLPSEVEQLRGASYVRHAREIRNALKRKDHGALLSELILVLERLERERG